MAKHTKEETDSSQSSSEEEQEEMSLVGSEKEESEKEESEKEESNKRTHSEEDKVPAKKLKVERIQKKQFGADGATVFVGQLSFAAKSEDIKAHFSQCGEVLDVRVRMHPDGVKSRGFAHVDFATEGAKNAAIKLDGTEFMGRTIRVDSATAAKKRTIDTNYGPKTNKVFVANLSYNATEDSLYEVFSKFGTIVGDIGLPIFRDTGRIRGIAYITYESEDEAEKAVKQMNGAYVDGRPIRTDFSSDNDRERLDEKPAHQKFSQKFPQKSSNRGGKNAQRGRYNKY